MKTLTELMDMPLGPQTKFSGMKKSGIMGMETKTEFDDVEEYRQSEPDIVLKLLNEVVEEFMAAD